MRAAIPAGYAKGFHTIIDANVVTAITALVLFAVATASVKGFALMLMIGTVISLITAVAATRAMLGLLAGFRWFENPSFMGASGEQSWRFLQIDFMRKRYLWFAISGTIVVISIGALAVKGLNLGIDFKGGTQVSFTTPQPTSLSSVREQTTEVRPGAGRPGPRQEHQRRRVQELPAPPADAERTGDERAEGRARQGVRHDDDQIEHGVRELRETDRALGDDRDPLLAAA